MHTRGWRRALTRPIRWDLIDANYDQVIKYATVIKDGTAATEAVLSRFTRSAYHAMLEIGRAQRTLFVARYLCGLQREIEAGLNVVELERRQRLIYFGRPAGTCPPTGCEEVGDVRAVPAASCKRPSST